MSEASDGKSLIRRARYMTSEAEAFSLAEASVVARTPHER